MLEKMSESVSTLSPILLPAMAVGYQPINIRRSSRTDSEQKAHVQSVYENSWREN